VVADFRAAIEESNGHITATGSPDAVSVVAVDGELKTLRWIRAHTTSEVIRHVGQADILREQIDGVTGR
jgi:hypothetical protein